MGSLTKAANAAARSGSLRALKAELEISGDINDRNKDCETLLMIAASHGDIAACMLLYNMGG